MAEDEKPETQTQQVFNINDPSVETIYANTTHIVVGEGDVTIHLGFQPIEGNNIPAIDVRRIILTHDSFMRMMEFWAARYRLLETLYEGKPKTLRDLDGDVVNAAFDTMLGRPVQTAETNEPTDISADAKRTHDSTE